MLLFLDFLDSVVFEEPGQMSGRTPHCWFFVIISSWFDLVQYFDKNITWGMYVLIATYQEEHSVQAVLLVIVTW